MKSDGTWKNFSVPALPTITEIKVDFQGNKWMVVSGNNGGVLVFNSGLSIDDESDDRFRFFNSVNSELKTNKINTIEVDLDGSVWVGTEQGPVIFRCGDVFEDICIGFRKLLVQNGVVAELLETENIKTIGIDGGNRKWIGTDNGLFVQSPEGDDQIFQFNSKNSKLLDDKIVDIAIDHENGNVYIGTQTGL
jgi:ligand-binding sensor domain-containing protein